MTQSALKMAFEKVSQLSGAEQAAAADMREEFVEQHTSRPSRSDAQIAEIRGRLEDPTPEYAADEGVDALYRRALHEN